MQKSMTSGNSLKLLLTFMVPLIIGNIFQQMYSISDIIRLYCFDRPVFRCQ